MLFKKAIFCKKDEKINFLYKNRENMKILWKKSLKNRNNDNFVKNPKNYNFPKKRKIIREKISCLNNH